MTSHRVQLDWMGHAVETLADLFPVSPKAICVGINPAPISVEAGHYYQGTLGKRFFGRRHRAGLLSASFDGFEDDALVADGIGFTDIVKRPTTSADLITAEERKHGAELLAKKLADTDARCSFSPLRTQPSRWSASSPATAGSANVSLELVSM